MRLKTIKLAGFKSFVDPTVLHLQTALTAVVGPNGCGKSNIVDAIRWVIGESSAKQLRGESLTDVIFNGTTNRKPVGQAAIELIFDNHDGGLGGEYAAYPEISIRRELNREAQSNFYLNGVRCRRRDIMDVFLGTGLGPRSYAIIEQGMISRVIESKPEEIRVFLEEAAGTSKYKERRRETELRMQHTRENLARLTDLREELDKQLNHLKRQAAAAEKFNILKQEQKLLRAQLHAMSCREISQQMTDLTQRLQTEELALEAQHAEHQHLETAIEKARQEQIEKNEVFLGIQERYYQLGAEISRYEQQIQHIEERRHQLESDIQQIEVSLQELEQNREDDSQQLEELTAEIAMMEPQLEQSTEQYESVKIILERAEEDMSSWQAQWDQFNQQTSRTNQVVSAEQAKINQLEQRIAQAQQRMQRMQVQHQDATTEPFAEELQVLASMAQEANENVDALHTKIEELNQSAQSQRQYNREVEQNRETVRNELQQLLQKKASLVALQEIALGKNDQNLQDWLQAQQIADQPRVAERIQVDAGWESAVEVVLGAYLEAVCVNDWLGHLDALQQFGAGQVTLVQEQVVSSHDALQGFALRRLVDKVKAAPGIQIFFDGVYIADDLAQAKLLVEQLAPHESIVTADGIWLGRNWVRIKHAAEQSVGVLQRKQEIEELQSLISEDQARLTALEDSYQAGQVSLHRLEEERQQQDRLLREASTRLSETKANLSAKQARFEQWQQQNAQMLQELAETQEQLSSLQTELLQARDHLEISLNEKAEQEAHLEILRQRRQDRHEKLQESRSTLQAVRQEMEQLQIRLNSTRNQLHYLTQNIQRSEKQITQVNERKDHLQEQLAEVVMPINGLREQLTEVLQLRLNIEGDLQNAREALNQVEQQLRQYERQRTQVDQLITSLRNKLEQIRVEQSTLQVHYDNHLQQIAEQQFELAAVLQELPAEANIDEWQTQLTSIENKIQRLGPINLAAIDEYQQTSERKTYLDRQNDDLMDALTTLENAIRKIDKETRTLLKETFEKVNNTFQTLFPKVFGGGQAALEMTEEDVLSTGILIKAQPPGKRNASIQLLSGGEKALTAIALVFSLFQLNPAPFCVLDEVDAPLDDANVGRFCKLVKEMSEKVQFIFISHNKITMELAEQLAGVTMSEPGVSRLVSVDIEQAIAMADHA